MTADTISQTVLFPNLFDKPLLAQFDQPHTSSDGGAVLLKAAEKVYGLVAGFVRCLVDRREPGKVRHTVADLLGQRIFGIACGHPDGNDAEHLADDPIHKLLLGRDPVAGDPLASQPTISRFENGATRTALYRMGRELATRVIERHARRLDGRARRIIIDLDPTDDRTHGAQQMSFFNAYYDSWCYLPLLAFLTFDRESDQYLCAALLRPGNVPATKGAIDLLARLLPLRRSAFPRAHFLVRLDGGFATPALFDFLEAKRVRYVVGMAKNTVLQRHAEPALKVEGVRLDDREPRDNPRFVVTNAAYVLMQELRLRAARTACARTQVTWLTRRPSAAWGAVSSRRPRFDRPCGRPLPIHGGNAVTTRSAALGRADRGSECPSRTLRE